MARRAVSAASNASSFNMSSSRRRRSASSDWAISIKNMGNGPRRMAPPRLVSGAGEGDSWDGFEWSDMVDCGEKGAGGQWPHGAGGGDNLGCKRTDEHGQHRYSPLDEVHKKETKGATSVAMMRQNKEHGARAHNRMGPPDGAGRRTGIPGLTRTGVRGEHRAGARCCNPSGA